MQVNYCCRFRGGLGGTYCDIVDFAGPGVCKGNEWRQTQCHQIFSVKRFCHKFDQKLEIYAATFCTDYDSFIPSIYYAITNVISFYGRQKSQSQSKKWVHNPFLFLMVINCRCDSSISDSFSVSTKTLQKKHPFLTGLQVVLYWLCKRNIFYKFSQILLSYARLKKILKDNHYKTIYWPVRSECSSCRVNQERVPLH